MLFRKSEEEKLRRKQEKLLVDFYAACKSGSRAEVEKLLGQGAPINDSTYSGLTPLFTAVAGGNLEVVKLLIERKARVNTKIPDDGLPAGFQSHLPGTTPLHIACQMNYGKIAEALIAAGADVTAKDDRLGLTPLHYAAKRGNTDVIKMLLDKGADINAKDKYGHTAEFFAKDNEHEAAAKFLKEKAAEKNPGPPKNPPKFQI